MAAVFSRNRPRDEEGESVFVSMTDLTVSFLFIILILLAFFATQYKPEETVSRDEYDTLIVELSKARHVIWQLEEQLSATQEYIDELEQKNRQSEARPAERSRVISELPPGDHHAKRNCRPSSRFGGGASRQAHSNNAG